MTTLLLAGCGKMGGALLARWRKAYTDIRYVVVEPASKDAFAKLSDVPTDVQPDIVVFAVKPQQMSDMLPAYAKRFGAQPLYLSIAAGKTIAFLESHLGKAPIVRAMPNLPAVIGESMTALCGAENLSPSHRTLAAHMMNAAGKTVWVEEKMMDAVTAVSGSGPAYLFLFMEVLARAAVKAGLPEDAAMALVRQTMKGSALLAETESVEILRKNVTSPGGTTEAALAVLLKNNQFENLLLDAVMAAMKRAHELNK